MSRAAAEAVERAYLARTTVDVQTLARARAELNAGGLPNALSQHVAAYIREQTFDPNQPRLDAKGPELPRPALGTAPVGGRQGA